MRPIDVLLGEITGDNSLVQLSEDIKYKLAVLIFVMQQQFHKELGLTDDINQWLAELDLQPSNIEAALKELRDRGILNESNEFRSSKDVDSGLTIILFSMVLQDKLDVKLNKEGLYAFKMTEKGKEEAEEILRSV